MRKDTIGDRVTLAIKRSRKKLEDIADDANVTAAWLSALKNDRIKNPPADKVRALAAATEHPISFFAEVLGWSDDEHSGTSLEDVLTWLRADKRVDEDGKASIERIIRLEVEAAERRERASEAPTPNRQDRARRHAV